MVVTEAFMFESTTTFSDNPDLVIPALKLVLAEDGAHSPVFYGKQIESPGMGYVFLNWDSREAHQKVVKSPAYGRIGEALKPSLGGKAEIYHIDFSSPTTALERPVTAVLVLSLKAPENRAAVVELFTKLADITLASGSDLAYGQTYEDVDKYFLIAGWPSIDAHREMDTNPEVNAALDELWALANKEQSFHAMLSSYKL